MPTLDPEAQEFDLAAPEILDRPLWKRLFLNFREKFFPEKLPPLRLTSRPVNLGILLGDYVTLPWYRTVFTNIGNVISPETLPPLELESQPVDVGELVSDQLDRPWWTSLLRNLADRIAPERMPALELSSSPLDASVQSGSVQVVRWSSVIALPKVPAAARSNFTLAPLRAPVAQNTATSRPSITAAAQAAAVSPKSGPAQGERLRSALSRSRIREGVWIGIAVAQGVYLLISALGLIR
jgi:hypothetical protein